jgi:hypothetical protein
MKPLTPHSKPRKIYWEPHILYALQTYPEGLWLKALTLACGAHTHAAYQACAMAARRMVTQKRIARDNYGRFYLPQQKSER